MQNRKAFTLVELMVVIVIVGILMAILIPALGAARRRVLEGRAVVELKSLETSLVTFKTVFGNEAPSGITLCERGTDWTAYPADMAKIRSLWPQFDFTADCDINANLTIDKPIHLNGAESLVFFLGGTVRLGTPEGFSKNPRLPFNPGGNRLGPFFEFVNNRLSDPDGNGYPQYRDLLGTTSAEPIIYYSMHEGQGFDTADIFTGANGQLQPYSQLNGKPLKQNSYQLISSGWDGILGKGGMYDPENAEKSLAGRTNEFDNLSNIADGKLIR